MKKTLLILSAFLLMFVSPDLFAQKNKTETNDYNLRKAYEVLQEEGDEEKALGLLNQQLKDTPDNVNALFLRARLFYHKKDIGLAISDINRAIKVNNPKKTGVANSFLHWWKATFYEGMYDFEKAAEEYKIAYQLVQKDDPKNLQQISFAYAQCLYVLDDLDGADEIYRKMLANDETDQAAAVGLARSLINREKYQEALDLLSKAQLYDTDYSQIYRFKMKAYDGLGESSKAIDCALDWCDKDEDADYDAVIEVLEKRPNYAAASIKSRVKKSEKPAFWQFMLCLLYEKENKYAEAVKCYDAIEAEYGYSDDINVRRCDCYNELGLFDKAIADISKVIDKTPTAMLFASRAEYNWQAGYFDDAIADYTSAIEEAPTAAYLYYMRGWMYEMKGDRKQAREDYDLGIELDDEYPYLYLMRGELSWDEGDKESAKSDFEKILLLDTLAEDGSCRHYALHFLGKDDEAQEWMDKIIAQQPNDAGNHYDNACLNARMGNLEKSVSSLRTAFEKGYRSFSHVRHDDDLNSIRDLPEYKALLEEYETKHAAYLKENEMEVPETEEQVTEISMKRSPGGTFEIPCSINGLALQMIFDTGASDVTISSVEANFMFKNGYLAENDIRGKRYYQNATGEINAGTVIKLREVKIGDAVLKNVDASVVKNQQAPLLLGQSALERFGTITIDNVNNKLIIKHK